MNKKRNRVWSGLPHGLVPLVMVGLLSCDREPSCVPWCVVSDFVSSEFDKLDVMEYEDTQIRKKQRRLCKKKMFEKRMDWRKRFNKLSPDKFRRRYRFVMRDM